MGSWIQKRCWLLAKAGMHGMFTAGLFLPADVSNWAQPRDPISIPVGFHWSTSVDEVGWLGHWIFRLWRVPLAGLLALAFLTVLI